jgi:hypothetical protein
VVEDLTDPDEDLGAAEFQRLPHGDELPVAEEVQFEGLSLAQIRSKADDSRSTASREILRLFQVVRLPLGQRLPKLLRDLEQIHEMPLGLGGTRTAPRLGLDFSACGVQIPGWSGSKSSKEDDARNPRPRTSSVQHQAHLLQPQLRGSVTGNQKMVTCV